MPVTVPAPPQAPTPIHDRAVANLEYIRAAMSAGRAFTSVPGWGGVLVGVSALAAAAVAASPQAEGRLLTVWLVDMPIALAIGVCALLLKARRNQDRLSEGVGRKFVLALVPPLSAAGLLTLGMMSNGLPQLVPAVWLLLFGVAVLAAGAFSVPAVPIMGVLFFALGIVAVFLPGQANLLLAIGFGGLNIGFGLYVARRYGG